MEEEYSKVLQVMKGYIKTKTDDWLISMIKKNGKSLKQWRTFASRNMIAVSRPKFLEDMTLVLGLTEQPTTLPTPIIVAFNQMVQIPFSLKSIQLYSEIQKRIKDNLKSSSNLNQYLQKEINYIIDLLQTGNSLQKYFQYILNQSKTINNPLSRLFLEMKFADFLVLLKKSTGSNYQIAYLLFQQVPVSITSSSNKQLINMRQCLSFLRCEDYSLITNIGTKNTMKYNKLFLIHDIFNLNDQSSKNTVFETNVNLLKIDNDRKIIMVDYTGPFHLIQPTSLSNKLIGKTSLLILHTTYNDLAEIIKQPPIFFQTIQKLLIFVWDQKDQIQISKQIFQLFNKESPLRKSIDEDKNLMKDYLIIAHIHPKEIYLLDNTEDIKQLLNSPLKTKKFNIHPEFYQTKIDKIEQFFSQSSFQSIKDILLNTYKYDQDNKVNTSHKDKVSPFVNNCLRFLKEQDYCQFTLFAEKLSQFKVSPLCLDDIIYQISIFNELTIDKRQQFPQSYAQNIINNYYQKCLDYFLPFNIINEKIHQFGNQSLQRFWTGIKSKQQKNIFIVSVIGADSFQKSKLINGLFRYNFYMRQYHLGRGLYMSLCQINNINVIVFNTSRIINQQISKFDHQILAYLLHISNLVLITNFEEDSKRLTQSLKICSLIRVNILLNQKKEKISPKIFGISKLFGQNLGQPWNSLSQIQKDDFFTIPTEENANFYGSFILNLRKRIVDYLVSKQRVSENFYEFYIKQKASWQLLNNISSKLFESKTYQQASQNVQQVKGYLLLNQQKKKQLIQKYYEQRKDREITKRNQKTIPIQQPSVNLNEKSLPIKIFDQVNIFPDAIDTHNQINQSFSNIQQITINNINQYYKNDIEQYFQNKKLQQLQLSIDSTLQKLFIQKLATNLEEEIKNNLKEIVEKQIKHEGSLNQDSIKHNLQQTFQIILKSQPILEGILSIDSINACVAFCNKFINSGGLFQEISIISQIEYFVEIQDLSVLAQIDRANINTMIDDQLTLLDKYFKDTYSSDSINEIQILKNCSQILVKINQSISNLVGNLKSVQLRIGKRLSLVEINFKKYALGTIYKVAIEHLLIKKKNQYLKKDKRIKNILKEFQQKGKILLEIRDLFLKQDDLVVVIEEKIFNSCKDLILNLVVKTNIVQISLKETLEKDIPEGLNQLKQLYKDCYKIVKNPQRYFNQKIFTQSNAILTIVKNQVEFLLTEQIKSIKNQIKQHEASFELKGINPLADRLRQQVSKRISQKITQTEIRLRLSFKQRQDEIFDSIKNKFTGSICKQKCPYCKAQCRNNVQHESHQIQHYLKAYGGPEVQDNRFDLEICYATETKGIWNQTNKLIRVWANIQDALILTVFRQAKKSQQKDIFQQREKQDFLTHSDLDEEIKGLCGLYKLRQY